MVEYVNGNILEADCEAITNATNCKGVMGAGLAHAFAVTFPKMYESYIKAHYDDELALGKLHIWQAGSNRNPKWIVNFPTMFFPGERALESSILAGLEALSVFLKENSIKSIALPALGCGIGRFPWGDFKKIIEEFSAKFPDVCFKVYEPHERR